MQKASFILNLVLLVAVAVLFYLYFSGKKNTPETKVAASTSSGNVPDGEFRIAYFEMDSINNSFALVKDVKSELSREEERINSELTKLQRTYNDKLIRYQNSQEASSQIESEKVRRDIMDLQNRISARKQELDQKFQDLYMRKMQEVKNTVEDFLTAYNKDKGYAYILAYEPGFIFYRDSALNITDDLVKGLNAQYKNKK